MKKIVLSQRQKNIIYMIPTEDEIPITVNEIADKLSLSSRTVQRDLAGIERFLDDNYFSLSKRPGIGIIFEENKETVNFLYELLDMVDSSKQYGRKERMIFTLSRLLTTNQAIKYQTFKTYLNISEKTLVEDFNQIQDWLNDYKLKLVKKRGKGVTIEGNEKDLRKAQSNLIYQSLSDEKRFEILRDITDETKLDLIQDNNILNMIDIQIIEKTRRAINTAFSNLNITIPDNSYIGLVVHISLAIERLKLNEHIDYDEMFMEDNVDSQEYIFSKKIVDEIEKEFNMKFPKAEISYIAMHIKGANIVAENQIPNNMYDVMESRKIAWDLIVAMEEIFHLDLTNDERLKRDLQAHLAAALTRLKLNFSTRNPILEDIKIKYSEIFKSLLSIVYPVMAKNLDVEINKEIPEDEIGFIAIHFITAIEKRIIETTTVNAITVCPTGYGTSRLLAMNLTNNISNINIVANASIMKINKEYLKEKNVDLIISTVKLEGLISDLEDYKDKFIEVSTILNKKDYVEITSKISELSRKKYYKNKANLKIEKRKVENKEVPKKIEVGKKSKAENILFSSYEMAKIYHNLVFFSKNKTNDLESLAASLVSSIEEEFIEIANKLRERNSMGGTYFKEYKLHLMHSACEVSSPRLAFGRLIDKDEIMIIMISRKREISEIKELFGRVSTKIVEDDNLINSIKNSDIHSIRAIILNEMLEIVDRNMEKGD